MPASDKVVDNVIVVTRTCNYVRWDRDFVSATNAAHLRGKNIVNITFFVIRNALFPLEADGYLTEAVAVPCRASLQACGLAFWASRPATNVITVMRLRSG